MITKMLKGAAALLLAFCFAAPAMAQATKTLKDGNGNTFTVLGRLDTSGDFYPQVTICDPSTASNCATVSGNALSVAISGGLPGFNSTPTFNIGNLGAAATAANQAAVTGTAAAGNAATASLLMGCIYNSAGLSMSPAQQAGCQFDQHGNLLVDIAQITGVASNTTTAGYTGSLIMGTVISGSQGYAGGTNQFLGMNSDGYLGADLMVATNNIPTQAHMCGSHVTVNPTTVTDTQLVASSSGKTIYVCDYNFSASGANSFYLESSTAGTCSGTLSQIDTEWFEPANGGKTDANPWYHGLSGGASNAVCLHTTAAQALSFTLYYDQF
jgi:hypothetical protein